MRVLYLHGFASSPRSSKAAFFTDRLAEHGIVPETPDFNDPDFSTLTITRMLRQVAARLDERPGTSVLIGSSLGGFVAVQAAMRHPDRVGRLVLLAPALDFSGNRMRDLCDRGIDAWRETDQLNVFHYAHGRVMPIRFELYHDAFDYDSYNAHVDVPIQIFQGRRDTAVDPAVVQRWAAARANVELHLLDDDHQLLQSLKYIWKEMGRFLGLATADY